MITIVHLLYRLIGTRRQKTHLVDLVLMGLLHVTILETVQHRGTEYGVFTPVRIVIVLLEGSSSLREFQSHLLSPQRPDFFLLLLRTA
jgi:hypothetical protein